ncbi:MAG: glycerol-3-phosphate 1-O-acyltransferase PlsY [Candidatus Nitrohelix vancouverensis]|uniref:Glycerol-3-phosphate acyltransferase n=1 Tax=Candidatus Nitrohelix vancouverensis TaxID=2705534 RepID=A0A7T0G4M1_9BACT|nr:MAG: glycerol-3-phosphate 1-O-acyltransferase PlsY [Candidatus Nitrohelix vancouverensis]
MELTLIIFLSYFLGSIPFGVVVARSQKINLQEHGSGNIGATNAGRVLGKKAGLITLTGDVLKGIAAVAIADIWLGTSIAIALAGLFAFIGHLFSVFLKFKGGKGVATGIGILAYAMPFTALSAIGIFGASLWVCRYVSLSSILASLSAPVFALFFHEPSPYVYLSTIVSLLIIARHRSNIERLVAGTESKFAQK